MMFFGLVDITLYGIINDISNRSELKRVVFFYLGDSSQGGFNYKWLMAEILFLSKFLSTAA